MSQTSTDIVSDFILVYINLVTMCILIQAPTLQKLEDLKVLRRSPDLLNNVKTGQGQLQLIMEQFCFYHINFGQVT